MCPLCEFWLPRGPWWFGCSHASHQLQCPHIGRSLQVWTECVAWCDLTVEFCHLRFLLGFQVTWLKELLTPWIPVDVPWHPPFAESPLPLIHFDSCHNEFGVMDQWVQGRPCRPASFPTASTTTTPFFYLCHWAPGRCADVITIFRLDESMHKMSIFPESFWQAHLDSSLCCKIFCCLPMGLFRLPVIFQIN